MLSRMNTVAARVNERRAKKKQFNNMPVKIKGKTVVAGLSVLILGLASCNTTNDRADVISGASPAEVERPVTLEEIAPPELKARILVVYFSQGEAARRVAEDLALLLDADIERIIEKKNRKGFFGFMGAGADSSFKRGHPHRGSGSAPGGIRLRVRLHTGVGLEPGPSGALLAEAGSG